MTDQLELDRVRHKPEAGPRLSEYIRQNAVTIDEFAGSGPKLLGLVVYLLQLAEAEAAPLPPPPSPEALKEGDDV
jgi:hypothetical protein